MATYGWLALLSLLTLTGAWPYTQRVRHPSISPLAAYLIFVVALAAMTSVMLGMVSNLLAGHRASDNLQDPVGTLGLFALTLAPGLLLASWLIQRPPRRAPLPGE